MTNKYLILLYSISCISFGMVLYNNGFDFIAFIAFATYTMVTVLLTYITVKSYIVRCLIMKLLMSNYDMNKHRCTFVKQRTTTQPVYFYKGFIIHLGDMLYEFNNVCDDDDIKMKFYKRFRIPYEV